MDINIGSKKTEKLVIYEQQSPRVIALEFAGRHRLDGNTQEKLYELLKTQIANAQR